MSDCTVIHDAVIYDRGGLTEVVRIPKITRIEWSRVRDDISECLVEIPTSDPACSRALELIATGRHEVVVFRNGVRVWEGRITHAEFARESCTLSAKDVVHYLQRVTVTHGYNNAYPNIARVTDRFYHMASNELPRFEALNPPINVLPFIRPHNHTDPDQDPRTSSKTLPYELTLFDELDNKAYRGGVDYVAIGRAIHINDVYLALGQGPQLGVEDFLGDLIITEYGMELATHAYVTDGLGHAGEAVIEEGANGFYGRVEYLDFAYDEDAGPDASDAPTVAEMRSQARRNLSGRHPVPIVVRVPDNSEVNPDGVLDIDLLVPGTWFPFVAELPGRRISQWQKLDKVVVKETGEKESIQVTFSPAPGQVAT